MCDTILVFSVHPDDETISCGGSILKWKHEGKKVFVAMVTEGNKNQSMVLEKIKDLYSLDNLIRLGFNENDIDDISLNKLIPAFSKVIDEIRPNILVVPNRSDPHSDHRRVFEAVQITFKSFRFPFIKKILMMETISETDFSPSLPENIFFSNYFVDTSAYFNIKMKIFNEYKSEILNNNLSRSISCLEAHDRYKGTLINANYAENFMIIKEIE